jgi:hypothetical protein
MVEKDTGKIFIETTFTQKVCNVFNHTRDASTKMAGGAAAFSAAGKRSRSETGRKKAALAASTKRTSVHGEEEDEEEEEEEEAENEDDMDLEEEPESPLLFSPARKKQKVS